MVAARATHFASFSSSRMTMVLERGWGFSLGCHQAPADSGGIGPQSCGLWICLWDGVAKLLMGCLINSDTVSLQLAFDSWDFYPFENQILWKHLKEPIYSQVESFPIAICFRCKCMWWPWSHLNPCAHLTCSLVLFFWWIRSKIKSLFEDYWKEFHMCWRVCTQAIYFRAQSH